MHCRHPHQRSLLTFFGGGEHFLGRERRVVLHGDVWWKQAGTHESCLVRMAAAAEAGLGWGGGSTLGRARSGPRRRRRGTRRRPTVAGAAPRRGPPYWGGVRWPREGREADRPGSEGLWSVGCPLTGQWGKAYPGSNLGCPSSGIARMDAMHTPRCN